MHGVCQSGAIVVQSLSVCLYVLSSVSDREERNGAQPEWLVEIRVESSRVAMRRNQCKTTCDLPRPSHNNTLGPSQPSIALPPQSWPLLCKCSATSHISPSPF
jgi:hypothetical protein